MRRQTIALNWQINVSGNNDQYPDLRTTTNVCAFDTLHWDTSQCHFDNVEGHGIHLGVAVAWCMLPMTRCKQVDIYTPLFHRQQGQKMDCNASWRYAWRTHISGTGLSQAVFQLVQSVNEHAYAHTSAHNWKKQTLSSQGALIRIFKIVFHTKGFKW